MSKQRVSFSNTPLLTYVVLAEFLTLLVVTAVHTRAEAVLYSFKPATVKQYSVSYRSPLEYVNSGLHFKQKNPVYVKQPPVSAENIFQIEASDAIDGIKYSQPDVAAYSRHSLNSGIKVPSSTSVQHKLLQISVQNPSPSNFQEQISSLHSSKKNSLTPSRDLRHLDSAVDEETHLHIENGESDYKFRNSNLENVLQTHSYDGETTNLYMQARNNFTDASDNLVSVSSDAVLSYEIPSTDFNDSNLKNSSVKQSTDIVSDVPSHNYSDFNSSLLPVSKIVLPMYTTENSIELNTHIYIGYINQTSDENVTNSLPSTDSEKKLSSGTVAGIVIAVLVTVTLLSSAVIYLLYRKFNGKCTSVVESKFNTDNCGYLDDSLRSSIYLNNHIELPKESSEEMTSLDNDSFLNSLETMTIQNYWADNSKNTKV